MQKFEVGSKIWFIDSDRPTVKLLLVSEEIVKKTISGNTTEYVFQVFHKGKKRDIVGSDLNGNFFEKREDAFSFMHHQAGDAINAMLEKATSSFPDSKVKEQLVPEENTSSEDLIVELPDGTKARIKGGIPS